jgi:hypothetical protein
MYKFKQVARCLNCGNIGNNSGSCFNQSDIPSPIKEYKDCPKCRKKDVEQELKNKAYQQEYFRYL